MRDEINKYSQLIREKLTAEYKSCLRESGYPFNYPFIVPGSESYSDVLWDWDSWLSNIALRQILTEINDPKSFAEVRPYEQGCVLNFLSWCSSADGWIPIAVSRKEDVAKSKPANIYSTNMHKPVIAQHAAFLVQQQNNDAEWLREKFAHILEFVNNYRTHHRHRCGLYYWQDDRAIGVDNDPCTYFRPPGSSGSIYLNCLIYKELQAVAYLCTCLKLNETAQFYEQDAQQLKNNINKYCWDGRDGFYYSVDLNLLPNENICGLHQGMPRDWDCLIQRIGVWSGFLAMWTGIANPQQAQRMVAEHYKNTETFNAPFGVRSLSKLEKMYNTRASGNPSNWLGPIWIIVNYFTFRGLLNYKFEAEAKELAQKTICLLGRDLERFGALHEYYEPDTGEPIMNKGFQNWNYLVLNMIAWLEGKKFIIEF